MMESVREMENPLAQDFTGSTLLRFALPTMVMMLFMGLYTIVDIVFVARFVGTDAMSAINIVSPVINLIVGLGTMLATGGSAIIARKMGRGEERCASQDFTLIVCAGTGLGLLLALAGTVLLEPMLWALGASRGLFSYCRDYLFVLLLFTPASILQVLFQNLIVTAGRPGWGMVLAVSAGLANLFLDYIFMVFLHMGIRGAALGTGIGYLLPAGFGVWYFAGRRASLRFTRPRLDRLVLAESCFNGFSEMLSQVATAVTTFFFNRVMMKLLGEDGVAAITIMIYTQFLLTTLMLGFSMGVAPVISYHYGRGDGLRLRKITGICIRFVLGLSAMVFLLSMGFGGPLIRAFSARETQVYAIAREGFYLFSFSFLFCGVNIFASAFFTALSNGKVSAIISSLRSFVCILFFLFTLPLFLGAAGVWLAVPLAEGITAGFSVQFMVKNRKDMGWAACRRNGDSGQNSM